MSRRSAARHTGIRCMTSTRIAIKNIFKYLALSLIMNKTQAESGESMDKNFLLVSLEEKKAKKIAEVINNDTSRKIINHLTQKESTETEISKELGIPISTVHYNLKQLQEAGLVVVDEFHYSSKGKEINHYALANKYIIIAPRSESGSKFIDALKKVLPMIIITAVVGFMIELYTLLTQTTAAGFAATKSAAVNAMQTQLAPETMTAAPRTVSTAAVTTQHVAAIFLISALSVIIIYFVYLWVKKE